MQRLKEPFGKAGLIVAVVALVFAMLGGAYAANGSGDATASAKNRGGNVGNLIKREAQKFSKRFSQRFSRRFAVPGPVGPRGFPGFPGPEGPKGDDGDDGDKGDTGTGKEGKEGKEGKQGPQGDSVVVGSFTGVEEEEGEVLDSEGNPIEPCNGNGGTEVEVEGSGEVEYVCNGEPGEEGSPWTELGTLPEGETLTGTYGPPEVLELGAPFPPLPGALAEEDHYLLPVGFP